ncbi:MAG TPA: hypothetical protein VFK05_14880 [Polyangiaceae bacterium]|nr:hypothetical protein [Polyangiaceae bacterium]
MIAAIHLDDEPRRRREKVHDETEHGHLAPKRDAKLRRAECAPELGLRIGRRVTQVVSVSGKD